MFDSRPGGHPSKDRADALVGQSRRRPVDERLVDVVVGYRGGEGIEPNGRGTAHAAGLTEKPAADQWISEGVVLPRINHETGRVRV